VHGSYIGYKCRRALEQLDDAARADHCDYTYQLLQTLYDNEVDYAHDLYDQLGWTPEVLSYKRFNANKALSNLGYEPLFAAADCQVDPTILSSLDPGARENHDFFSGSGSSYVVGKRQPTEDADWDF
jgi:ribonucleoside-diphosphate reductase beta chain